MCGGTFGKEQSITLQPPFLCPVAPGPEVGLALPVVEFRENVLVVPIVALAFRSSIFLRSISSCWTRVISTVLLFEQEFSKPNRRQAVGIFYVPPCALEPEQPCHPPPAVDSHQRGMGEQLKRRPLQ